MPDDWGHYTYRNLPKIYDAHIITAEYLIDNIDRALIIGRNVHGTVLFQFEDFCGILVALSYRGWNRWKNGVTL